MASKPFSSKQTLVLVVLCLTLTLTTYNLRCYNDDEAAITTTALHYATTEPPGWYDKLQYMIQKRSDKLKIGLVNLHLDQIQVNGLADVTTINFKIVDVDKKWEDFFPEWVDEDGKWGPMKCPEIPMPRTYEKVDVVVARVPDGVRDVFRLQVNLVVANVLVKSGLGGDGEVYVVFIGRSGPMWEIFRCDDMIWEESDYKIYKPDLKRLQQKVNMPVGSCMISSSLQLGGSTWHAYKSREAYVTVLHSSETYVCGAIALAQSILQTNSTKDLVLLADDSISPKSLGGLKAAGWKIKLIKRIRSPHAEKGAYNEYNYSKLRIWQLIEYAKVMFIDADLLVLKNLDEFFSYPQLSAVGNDRYMFNSGLMLIEPSQCMFNNLMKNIYTLGSYNGGDQGFLNEAFTWWHRFHSKVNHLKVFQDPNNPNRKIKENLHTIHYLGLKPWVCYKDYDCNWDMMDRRRYASDSAHKKWWEVYDTLPSTLKPFCGLTKKMDARIHKWRGIAKRAGFRDQHWKIKVKDRRRTSHMMLATF
ncbi:putative glucuronosyltransferase [Helianthus annuus]|uniref:Hexosyltransferase n=1 Tax=Helianthus annuus TaxID=4232 RepID=A0A251SUD4_HELAN|nr:putative UDP-glucuronate:xylan alpha-glucuronosyltransferase 5 [Helianthus annuus]KAF5809923.1 putative glucuronosyltransferase [Helianthus annuus]KAJ0588579.1 putative glucuronosyltransferase [Helianthus annuus]KAJ0926604.1 putative glucuronosyltransferase [Helianthus annuus]KAJ0931080.1 putative glucuronosyltransferase [Helianthus annuus]